MYRMKNIINYDEEIVLPKCMYHLRNQNESLKDDIELFNLNISDQVKKFLKVPNPKMTELEQRQEVLIQKLDLLYNRIKAISSYCNQGDGHVVKKDTARENNKYSVPALEEAVLVVNPDNLPYYLNIMLKNVSAPVNLSWHIHSTVPNDKVAKIKGFVKSLKSSDSKPHVHLRLIFNSASAYTELKLSSLSTPIVGTVNILRYLSFIYPNIISYNHEDFNVDTLLDVCHLLENSSDKSKEPLIKKLFSNSKEWVYNDQLSIIDIAVYNVVKQSKSLVKLVPKNWFDKCEKSFN